MFLEYQARDMFDSHLTVSLTCIKGAARASVMFNLELLLDWQQNCIFFHPV